MHEEIDINNQIKEEFNHEDTNYYNFFELDYYELDTFNQPDNPPNAYHVEDPKKYKYCYYGSYFP